MTSSLGSEDHLARILNHRQPFGPPDTESVVSAGCAGTERLFDTSNLIYAQAVGTARPAYIIGRKGAGKTAFLLSTAGPGRQPEMLRTATVYSEMVATLRCYTEHRGPLFVEQIGKIWAALFDHVALAYACRTATANDTPHELQTMWDYLDTQGAAPQPAVTVAEQFLADLQRRIKDRAPIGLAEVIDGMERGGVRFAAARSAMRVVLPARTEAPIIVMDNLEDLHERLHDLREVLAGLFGCIGQVIEQNAGGRPFGVHVCLPSELFETIHEISANPEKDFRGNYLTIYWTARELLHLAGTRLRLYLQTHHPEELRVLEYRVPNARDDVVALLRSVLPDSLENGLGRTEDPVAYLLRHTQLLPRHLIELLNRVFTARCGDSAPWAVSPDAIRRGTRVAEDMIVRGVLSAHREAFPTARKALGRLSDRLGICFRAQDLHKVYNREGIKKITGLEFGEFLQMLFDLGVLGVKVDRTARYNKADFQYTFDSRLNPEEDADELCVHPLFTRYLHERSLPRLRREGALPTYPYGSDPADGDYRLSLGYADRPGRGLR
jgi:hypothetical protein